jgi:DNA-binding response OmpR family regulator
MYVLLVESDDRLASYLVSGLQRNGHEVDRPARAAAAVREARRADLVLLDLDVPDTDGLELCRTISLLEEVSIISLTRQRDELTRVTALRAGSDDCIEKPFGFRELLARIDAVTRRANPTRSNPQLSYPPLCIDSALRGVSISGHDVDLTEKEFDLLWFLASRPGAVISREEIMARVWGDLWNRRSRTIDTHVSSIRGKLGQQSWIATVRGVGFRFRAA